MRGIRQLVTLAVGSAVLAGAAACSSAPRAASSAATLPSLDRFCSEAQKVMAKTTIEPENVVVVAKDEFGPSKATIRPLSTRQFNVYADEQKTQLTQISCKMKTTDHLRTEYGAGAAGEEGLCADVNRRTLAGVLQGFDAGQRRALRYDGGRAVVFDAEQVTTNGFEWLAPYPIAWQGPDGALHIMAKAQRNDWLDQRYLDADPKFRGTRYCHFIAPDYLRRILLGEVAVGTTPPPPLAPPIR
jgi:hypothetical protein